MSQATGVGAGSAFNFQGIGLSTYSEAGYADAGVTRMIDQAATSGANQVVLSNVVLADLSAGTISPLVENGFNQTAPLADVGAAVDAAHAAGLEVLLKPQIAVRDAAYDQYNSASWIMMVNPDLTITNPDAFFAAYKTYILKWATLAEQHHAEALSIGNEMVAATKPQYTAYWNDIIDAVRGVFHGELTYSALAPLVTNAGANEIAQIGFWNKLDFAGFDVYPSLTQDTNATPDQLAAGWRNATVYGHQQDYVAFLDAMAQKVGKPVVFTETGLPSFDGASDRQATSDGTIGTGARATDQAEQAAWWQAFFKVWATDPPAWLKGLVVYNNDPANLGAYYDQNYNVNGKAAESVVTAWYGGATVIAPTADALSGGQADDQIYLYDPATPHAASQAASLTTEIAVTLTAAVQAGAAPTIHVRANGVDLGAVAIKAVDSGYVNSAGQHFTADQTYVFDLPGLTPIRDLRISLDTAGGSAFVHSVSVNGVAVAQDRSLAVGGDLIVESTPWNAALASRVIGAPGHPITVDGGAGFNTVHLLGSPSQYAIVRTDADTVRLSETAGLGQNTILKHVSAVDFADGTHLDLATVGAPTTPVTPVTPVVTLPAFPAITPGDPNVSVATLTYEFFTGAIPSAAGMDYLVSPTGPNPNNLNSAYYQHFNMENRYINFAVNLGKSGEGRADFAATYGGKDLFAATTDAYQTIFGAAPTADKVHALLDATFVLGGATMTRADYFAAYGQDGLNGLGTKAAMVGWLLAEADKADVGVYAEANNAFLADAADGAAYGVDIVGVYGGMGEAL
jgi:hypothetical protein